MKREIETIHNPLEETLRAVCAGVLKVERVGADDNLFESGEADALPASLATRIRDAFGVEMTPDELLSTPTVAGLAARIEAARTPTRAVPPIVAARGEQSPLSFAQHNLWLLNRRTSNASLYNVPAALRLKGGLEVGALERAINEVVRRHEVLRTTFSLVEGQPRQLLHPAQHFTLAVTDLGHLHEQEREEQARRLAHEEARAPFDLSTGPLLRASLLRLAEDEHVLLLTMHRIVSDGWSVRVLIREVSALYEAFSKGETSPLEELTIQYADYALWQRQWLSGDVLDSQLSYWREQLAGVPPVLELPADHPRPAVQSYLGARLPVKLSAGLTAALKRLSQEQGVTLFMTLLAGFQLLLSRYTGQEDIVVGSPVAGRTRREMEPLIGCFINTVALRARVRGSESFAGLMREVRGRCLGAYGHQEVPFERVVEELGVERELSRTPLFQVTFALQDAPCETMQAVGLSLTPTEVDTQTTRFDLALELMDEGETLSGSLLYSLDRFDEARMRRMVGHLERLLESAVAEPQQAVSELMLLTEREREQALEDWSGTRSEYPRWQCIHELFEAQVERTPEKTALVFEEREFSYDELNRRANQVARHLRMMGVGPDVRVGLLMERSAEMVVGLLGILKAGGAYVPLDQSYPPERLAFMLENAEVPLLLAQEHLTEVVPGQAVQFVCIDTDWDEIARQDDSNLKGAALSQNLAYIIYTSGSSGQPKGVMIQHESLVARVQAMQKAYALDSSHRVLQFISIGFDASAEELFPTLTGGATLVILRDPQQLSGAELLLKCEQLNVSCLHLPSPYWHQMVDDLSFVKKSVPASIRLLITGGEAVSVERLETWMRLTQRPSRYFNAYGPTEATVTSTLHELAINPPTITPVLRVPIGRPIENTVAYVLDAAMGLVPEGIGGELYIGGAGLARGYVGDAAQTAERFVPDPYTCEIGARLYRTGDRVRRLGDGRLEFLGRADAQVKLRGYRVELGEIEAALCGHGGVREAAVMVAGAEGREQLAALIVAADDANDGASAAELREYLKGRLPEYMIPARIAEVSTLPLTPNGKVDRRELARMAEQGAESGACEEYEGPRNALEEIVCGIWQEVLKAEAVGIHQNFFELGGHSLLATQVVLRMQEAFQVEVSLRTLFEGPTVAEQAQIIEGLQASQRQEETELLEMLDGLSADELESLLAQAMAEES